jgi:hypothetical protein
MTDHEAAVMQATRNAFIRGPFSGKCVAQDEQERRRIEDECLGRKTPRATDLRRRLPVMLKENPAAALDYLSSLLGLDVAGVVLAMRPRFDFPGQVVKEAAEVGAAAGEVQRVALAAAEDGFIDAEEGAVIERVARHAAREIAQVGVIGRQAQKAQLRIGETES